MEIDITHMMIDLDLMPTLSGSIAEHGQNAGPITWSNSKDYAAKNILLHTPAEIAEAKKFFQEFGAWERDEIAAWDTNEVNALLVQYIAGDIRERQHYADRDELEEYEENHGGRIFQSGEKFYFYVGM